MYAAVSVHHNEEAKGVLEAIAANSRAISSNSCLIEPVLVLRL